MISLPDALLHLLAKFPEGFLGPIPDFDKGMEKTQDHRDLMEQSMPRILRGWPAIGIDGFRSILGIHRLGFTGKDTLGLL
jgi:hypothetical protein